MGSASCSWLPASRLGMRIAGRNLTHLPRSSLRELAVNSLSCCSTTSRSAFPSLADSTRLHSTRTPTPSCYIHATACQRQQRRQDDAASPLKSPSLLPSSLIHAHWQSFCALTALLSVIRATPTHMQTIFHPIPFNHLSSNLSSYSTASDMWGRRGSHAATREGCRTRGTRVRTEGHRAPGSAHRLPGKYYTQHWECFQLEQFF